MSDEPINTTHNIRTCPCAVCRQLQGRHEAFVRGLNRGLELAKEHARVITVRGTSYSAYEGFSEVIEWKAADEAVAKEGK